MRKYVEEGVMTAKANTERISSALLQGVPFTASHGLGSFRALLTTHDLLGEVCTEALLTN